MSPTALLRFGGLRRAEVLDRETIRWCSKRSCGYSLPSFFANRRPEVPKSGLLPEDEALVLIMQFIWSEGDTKQATTIKTFIQKATQPENYPQKQCTIRDLEPVIFHWPSAQYQIHHDSGSAPSNSNDRSVLRQSRHRQTTIFLVVAMAVALSDHDCTASSPFASRSAAVSSTAVSTSMSATTLGITLQKASNVNAVAVHAASSTAMAVSATLMIGSVRFVLLSLLGPGSFRIRLAYCFCLCAKSINTR